MYGKRDDLLWRKVRGDFSGTTGTDRTADQCRRVKMQEGRQGRGKAGGEKLISGAV